MRRPRMASALASFLGTALALSWSACAAVPDIRFVDDDAGEGSPDGGTDDAAVADTGSDAPACPGTQPAAATCCGTVWCVGQCDSVGCAECEQKGCAAGELCCGKKGQALCKANCP